MLHFLIDSLNTLGRLLGCLLGFLVTEPEEEPICMTKDLYLESTFFQVELCVGILAIFIVSWVGRKRKALIVIALLLLL